MLLSWKKLRPGESIPIGQAEIKKAHRARYYWHKVAKRPRKIRLKRIRKGEWLMIRQDDPEVRP